MLDFPTWRKVWLWLVTLICVVAALPSLLSATSIRWPDALPDPMVNLGLDLAGGSHILLEADGSQVAAQRLDNMEENVRNTMRRAEPRIRIGDVELTGLKDKALTALRRDEIGFVFQSFNLVPTLTAKENVLLPLAIAGALGAPLP